MSHLGSPVPALMITSTGYPTAVARNTPVYSRNPASPMHTTLPQYQDPEVGSFRLKPAYTRIYAVTYMPSQGCMMRFVPRQESLGAAPVVEPAAGAHSGRVGSVP